ncbi:e3 ubiquitin-protein ligase siah2 [Holotrichia oblita]|uniref:E3 ubiquitin-protein ligase siah2 n=1 Tax=Holotrichia oblita TaxID=644536 RepID=A0ACB9SSS0_HOLOL|nr:e3 ubiquitin-protein ligase siah2 [Holotrichia oblita]
MSKLNEISSTMECPICMEYMVAPIFVCSGGHSLCGKCYPKVKKCPMCFVPLGKTRNYALESLMEALAISNQDIIPSVRECPFSKDGCQKILSSCDYDEHKSRCPYRKFKCIFYVDEDFSESCTYVGRRLDLKQHVLHKHKHDVFDHEEDMLSLELPFLSEQRFVYHEKDIFYFHVQEKEGVMYWWLQHLGDPRKGSEYSYTVRIFTRPYTHREYQCKENCVKDEDFDSVISKGLCPSVPAKVLETYPDNKWYTLNICKLPQRK